jgi:hypothetical protein
MNKSIPAKLIVEPAMSCGVALVKERLLVRGDPDDDGAVDALRNDAVLQGQRAPRRRSGRMPSGENKGIIGPLH